MSLSSSIGRLKIASGLLVIATLINPEPIAAQAIKADNTLGTAVESLSPVDFKITGGRAIGPNLFHSFQQFSIPTTGSATFDLSGLSNIRSVFGRITGSTVSNLDGILGITNQSGRVSLFLMNPNGIVFGANARLNIGGSFLGTTASSIHFSDGLRFDSGIDANAVGMPLLSVKLPIGLQFGANAGSIVNLAPLAVAPGLESIGLIGNGVTIDGGQLIAYEGHVELGSVGAGSFVGWERGKANYAGVTNVQNLMLTNEAVLEASGTGPGSIQIQGREILIEGYSRVFSQTRGAGIRSSTIALRASEQILIKDADGDRGLQTLVGTENARNSFGNASSIIVEAPILDIQGGAQIRASNFGLGQGSDIAIRVGALRAIGESEDTNYISGIANRSERGATGPAGTTTIEAQSVTLQNGAQIRTSTFGGGRGGDLYLTAQNLTLSGRSKDPETITGITASSKSAATARGGDIRITVDQLKILDSSGIRTTTEGRGDAGDIYITAKDILMASPETVPYRSVNDISYIGASTQRNGAGAGKGGSITIATNTLTMRDGANILSESYGSGAGGSLRVSADRISATGFYIGENQDTPGSFTFYPAGFSTATYFSGLGGDIVLNAREIQFSNGAEALSATFGRGNAGNITIAADKIDLSGQWTDPRFKIDYINLKSGFLSASNGFGNAGDIKISTQSLNLSDNAILAIGSYRQGNAGNLQVNADRIKLDTGSMINSDVIYSTKGNVNINSKIIELRHGSSITTNAPYNANSGNIQLNSEIVIGLENSDITANAVQGRGGTIGITASSILGLRYRDRLTPDNDITASSQTGLNGTVTVNSLNLDPTNGISSLASNLVDPSRQISNNCNPQAKSKFIITGHGGVAKNPIDQVVRLDVWGDIRPVSRIPSTIVSTASATDHNSPIQTQQLIEASAFSVTRNSIGLPEIELIAPQPKNVSQISATCAPETRSPKI